MLEGQLYGLWKIKLKRYLEGERKNGGERGNPDPKKGILSFKFTVKCPSENVKY